MKSTGLFGKNSGRVGGVVYSTYRGEQIVRAYQPKVNNPNSTRQVAQRAKFKLVSQVSASLRSEINMSFMPSINNQSSRNAFMREMLKKTTYTDNEASLPIEDIRLTNSNNNAFETFGVTTSAITAVLQDSFPSTSKVRVVVIGYTDGGEITLLSAGEATMSVEENKRRFTYVFPTTTGYTHKRALFYAYSPSDDATTYEDYSVLGEDATLKDVLRVYSRNVIFSQTINSLIPQGV